MNIAAKHSRRRWRSCWMIGSATATILLFPVFMGPGLGLAAEPG
jgi:hypothetical protein